jgi:hypothetical protein
MCLHKCHYEENKYDFFVAKCQKGRLTTLSCLTVMHVIVGLACLLQFIKTESNRLFFGGKGVHQWEERLEKIKIKSHV